MPTGACLEQLGLRTVEEKMSSEKPATPVQLQQEMAGGKGNSIPGEESTKEETPKGTDSSAPFVVGEGLPVIPAKLVAKIQRGDYVDMAELLKDNVEVDRRRSSSMEASVGAGKPSRREVPDLMSWLQCFGIYASIFTAKFPQKTKQLWAYQTLIVREARRCGGGGWREYDSMFRQQKASAVELEWDRLNTSLFAVTFLVQQGKGTTCRHCQGTDHGSAECALAPIPAQSSTSQSGSFDRRPQRESRAWRPPLRERGACFSWNAGRCVHAPYCRFKHVCSTCAGEHRAVECRRQSRPSGGEESASKRDTGKSGRAVA